MTMPIVVRDKHAAEVPIRDAWRVYGSIKLGATPGGGSKAGVVVAMAISVLWSTNIDTGSLFEDM
jgi:hypothetical protein